MFGVTVLTRSFLNRRGEGTTAALGVFALEFMDVSRRIDTYASEIYATG